MLIRFVTNAAVISAHTSRRASFDGSMRTRVNSDRASGPRRILAVAFFVMFLLMQVAVPLFQLTQPRPARFGWQMFSTLRADALGVSYHIEAAGGELIPVQLSAHFARVRLEIDHRTVLPPYLCEVTPGAAAVISERGGTTTGRYPCP
jgi:hypothetical protein